MDYKGVEGRTRISTMVFPCMGNSASWQQLLLDGVFTTHVLRAARQLTASTASRRKIDDFKRVRDDMHVVTCYNSIITVLTCQAT